LARDTLEIAPDFGVAHSNLVDVYEQKGMYEQAIAEHQALGEAGRRRALLLEQAYRAAGARGYWQKSLKLFMDEAKRIYIAPTIIAGYYATMRDRVTRSGRSRGWGKRTPTGTRT
jgi:tetratricopeptide (TPR) repeat protein